MSKIFLILNYLQTQKNSLPSNFTIYPYKKLSKKFSLKPRTSTKSSKFLKEAKKEKKENTTQSTEQTTQSTKKAQETPRTNESIFIFSHDTAKKYYLMNFSFLSLYSVLCAKVASDPEYPDFLRTSMNGFIGLTTFGLMAILFFSKRHVYSIYLQKPSNILLIKTYSKFGFSNKQYQLPVNDIKEMISVDRKFKKFRTGLYMIKPTEKYKYFKFLNVFFIRPSKSNNYVFDEIFAKKLKK
jgi:hypothetical protein